MKNFVFVALWLLVMTNGFAQTTIASYNFNSGVQGWTLSGANATGSRIFMNGGGGTKTATSPTINLAGISQAQVSVDWNCVDNSSGFESNDVIRVEYLSGSSWVVLWRRNGNQICSNEDDNQSGNTGNLLLPSGLSSTRIRLVSTASSSSEDIYWDNVVVSQPVDPCDPIESGNPDTDGDGISDVCDLDDDNDGILDEDEGTISCGNEQTIGLTSASSGDAASTVLNGTNNEGAIGSNNLTLTNYLNASNINSQVITNSHPGQGGFGSSEYAIQTFNGGLSESQRIGTRITPEQNLQDFSFQILDLDDGDRIIVNAFDQNGNIISLNSSIYSITSTNDITYTSPNRFAASNNEYNGTQGQIFFDYTGFTVSKLEV